MSQIKIQAKHSKHTKINQLKSSSTINSKIQENEAMAANIYMYVEQRHSHIPTHSRTT